MNFDIKNNWNSKYTALLSFAFFSLPWCSVIHASQVKVKVTQLCPTLWDPMGYTAEKAIAPHSSTLAWRVPWTVEPGRIHSMGSLRVGHDWATSLSLFTFMHWRRKWQPTPVILPGESQGGEPGGLPSMGSHRVGHNWRDLAVAGLYSPWNSPGQNTGVGSLSLLQGIFLTQE